MAVPNPEKKYETYGWIFLLATGLLGGAGP